MLDIFFMIKKYNCRGRPCVCPKKQIWFHFSLQLYSCASLHFSTFPLGKRIANGCFWLNAVYNKFWASKASLGGGNIYIPSNLSRLEWLALTNRPELKVQDLLTNVKLAESTITFGDIEFKDGIATFTLKHNQTKTAIGLPIGITYTVTESDNEGYTFKALNSSGSYSSFIFSSNLTLHSEQLNTASLSSP